MLQFIAASDHKLMHKVNNWPAPKWIRFWAVVATRAGDGWLWGFIGLFIFSFGGGNRVRALASASVAAATAAGMFMLTKKFALRMRPFEVEPHCWAKLLPPDRFSFPSGHTITAFAVSVALGQFYPALLPALLFCALSIAASRILLGMHFLSDVIAGAVLGTGLGLLAHSIFV